MTAPRGPLVQRRLLGAELKRLRDGAGLRLEQVAAHLECSPSKISRLETGKGVPRSRDVRDLLDLYHVTDSQLRDRLLAWSGEARRPPWWSDYAEVVTEGLGTYLGYELEASCIRSYQVAVMPGLLQTDDYARAVISGVRPDFGPRQLDRLVELRRRREEVLSRDDPPALEVVLDEAVLHHVMGSPQVMREQLTHLLRSTRRPGVTVRVIPFSAGAHPGMGTPFTLLEFPDAAEKDVVHIEGDLGMQLEQAASISKYHRFFAAARAKALDTPGSTRLIKAVLESRYPTAAAAR